MKPKRYKKKEVNGSSFVLIEEESENVGSIENWIKTGKAEAAATRKTVHGEGNYTWSSLLLAAFSFEGDLNALVTALNHLPGFAFPMVWNFLYTGVGCCINFSQELNWFSWDSLKSSRQQTLHACHYLTTAVLVE